MIEPLVAIRALEHHSYCARQCALIHGDGVWADNSHTVRGVRSHRRVDRGNPSTTGSIRVLRSIPLWSEVLGLTGRSDVVEIHSGGSVVPVEYKAGRRHGEAAHLQLCAQALCLEEMLGVRIDHGYLWFGGTRRRLRVDIDQSLRARTIQAIDEIRGNIRSALLPPAANDVRCGECQLLHYCLPEVVVQNDRLTLQSEDLFRCDI